MLTALMTALSRCSCMRRNLRAVAKGFFFSAASAPSWLDSSSRRYSSRVLLEEFSIDPTFTRSCTASFGSRFLSSLLIGLRHCRSLGGSFVSSMYCRLFSPRFMLHRRKSMFKPGQYWWYGYRHDASVFMMGLHGTICWCGG